MRGKVRCTGLHHLIDGITPAYAGKSKRIRLQRWVTKDHPRVCGEKRLIVFVFRAVTGSPPRMRGKVIVKTGEIMRKGITPAYAGKRHHCERHDTKGRDHPRVCGEKRANL